MKRLLILALCALFALNAEARTIYVDAKRPNNNGNGLSAKKAKKTIQAAINVAKKGDTILVLPGTYAPIRTNNKKVAIKSVKGRAKTSIVQPSKKNGSFALASLGKVFTYKGTGRDAQFRVISVVCKSAPVTKGTASKLTGFLLDGKRRSASRVIGVTGGTVKACSIRGLGHLDRSGDWLTIDEASAAVNSKLTVCEILDNQYATTGTGLVSGSILQRCSIRNNRGNGYSYSSGRVVSGSKLYNCLVAGNSADAEAVPVFSESLLINCTVADNALVHRASSVKFSKSSKWFNCVLRDNRSQRKTVRYEYGYYDSNGKWVEDEYEEDEGYEDENGVWVPYDYQSRSVETLSRAKLHNVDGGNVYKNTDKTNRDPKLTSAYKLGKGSYCINSGKLTKSQKKLVGTKDLAGKKRIKGKAIDRGCYEY